VTIPPAHIGKAVVLGVADLDAASPTGRTRHTVDGREVVDFAALAIVKYEGDSGVYLFYCDDEWNRVTDTYHDNWEHAVAQAEFEFGPVEFEKV
jgi:hypothetical protein